MSKKRVAIALAILCIAAVAQSQSPVYLVKDINETNAPYGSYPDGFVTLGSLSIFTTNAGFRNPQEVWRSDGTAAGTYSLGAAGGRPAVWNGKVWFPGRDGGLYSSDGSQPALATPLPSGVSPELLFPSGPWLYFFANRTLWRTDGTAAGTGIVPGSPSSLFTEPVMAGQSALFLSESSANRYIRMLWRADAQVQEVLTFTAGYSPARLISAGPIAYMLVYNGTAAPGQTELWRTDGTPAGTFVLKSSLSGTTSYSAPYLYFNAGGSMWRTDGSLAGTVALPVTLPQPSPVAAAPLGVLANGTLIMSGPAVAAPENYGFDGIWAFAGTSTTFLFNLPRAYGLAGKALGNVFIVGGKEQLWRTDGTAGGSYKLADLKGDDGNFIWPMGVAGSTLFFGASDPSYGWELRKTDGTVQNTVMVKDIVEATYPSFPATLLALNGGVVFTADGAGEPRGSGYPRPLWFSDGTAAGTRKLLDDSSVDSENGVVCGERLFFAHETAANGLELWSSNGTPLGTALVKDLHPGVAGSSPHKIGCLDDRVMFFTESPSRGLWRSDGTAAGTLPVAAVPQYAWAGRPVQFGQGVFFTLSGDLWLSDGTSGGTRLVRQVGAGPSPIVVAGYNAYLLNESGTLWRTDGSAAGTTPVAMQGSAVSLFGYGDRVAFQKRDPDGLCSTDGASVSCFDPEMQYYWDGTFSMLPMNGRLYYPMSDLRSTDGVSSTSSGLQGVQRMMAAAGGRLYFAKSSGPLYETDGTAAGSRPLHDRANETVASGGRLFIAEQELYAYDLPATPTSLAPRTVPVVGGPVVIHGRGFVSPVSVYVDRTPGSVLSVTPAAITFTAPPRRSGTYEVKIVTGDGREMTTDQRLAYACSPLTATVGPNPPAVCPLTPVQLHGGGGSRCAWFPVTGLDNPSSCTPVATVSEATTYTLIVADEIACSSTNHPTVTVTVRPKPSTHITFSEGPYVPGGTYTASVPDAGPGASYAWTVTGAQVTSVTYQRSVAFLTSCENPKLSVVVTAATGCSASSTSGVIISSPFTITSVSPRNANAGALVTVTGTGLNCVAVVALHDPSYGRALLIPYTVVSPTSLTFRLSVYAPPAFYVEVANPFLRVFDTQLTYRPLRDDFTGGHMITDILTRNATTGLAEVHQIPRYDELAGPPILKRAAGSSDYTVAAVYDFGGTTPAADILWQRSSTRELILQLSGSPDVTYTLPRIPSADLTVATIGDLDGNGFPELIMRSSVTGATQTWTLTSGWTGVNVQTLHGGGNLNWKIVGSRDFDGDGKHDLLWRDTNSGMTLLWFMNGASIRASQIVHQGGNTGWTIAALGDFDADIKTDILWRNPSTGMTLLWKMNGAAITSSTAIHPGGNTGWTIVATGDFNGDSKADVLWRESSQGTVLVWRMSGAQILRSSILFPTLDPAVKIESPRM